MIAFYSLAYYIGQPSTKQACTTTKTMDGDRVAWQRTWIIVDQATLPI